MLEIPYNFDEATLAINIYAEILIRTNDHIFTVGGDVYRYLVFVFVNRWSGRYYQYGYQ